MVLVVGVLLVRRDIASCCCLGLCCAAAVVSRLAHLAKGDTICAHAGGRLDVFYLLGLD